MILTLSTIFFILLAGLLVSPIFDLSGNQGMLGKGFVYLSCIYLLSSYISRFLIVDFKITFWTFVGLTFVLAIVVSVSRKIDYMKYIKPSLLTVVISLGCVFSAFVFYYSLIYYHPETMVSLGSQWNTSILLSQIQQLFVNGGWMESMPSMVVPFHGTITLVASLCNSLPFNAVPVLLQLFSILYVSIFLESVITLARRLKFDLVKTLILLVASLVLFNNIYDLYFSFVADVWIWLIIIMCLPDKHSSVSSIWQVMVIMFAICFGTFGTIIAAICVLLQFGYIIENASENWGGLFSLAIEVILIGISISKELLVAWVLIVIVCVIVTVIETFFQSNRFWKIVKSVCVGVGVIALVWLSLEVGLIENFAIQRNFLSSTMGAYEAFGLSLLMLWIGIKGHFSDRNYIFNYSFIIGGAVLVIACVAIFKMDTALTTTLLLSTICFSPLTCAIVIFYISQQNRSSVYLSGVVLVMLFCSIIPWENAIYADGTEKREDFDHINRMPYAESEIYAALRQDMSQSLPPADSYRIISQAPFTQAVFFNDEIVHSYLDYINTCQYCDVQALQLHEPSELFNIFVPREYSDNRLFIELPKFQQTCALLSEAQIDYIIYQSDMNTDASMQWLSMRQLLSGCTTVIHENSQYILARVNPEVSE